MTSLKQAALFACLAFASAAAHAQALTGTLQKAKETGTITVGYRESSIPFSYLDNNGRPIGYAMELCAKITDAVKAELKMPDLKVNYSPVTSSNRIPLLEHGTIDLECGSTTNSVARQKQVAFGPTYFVINVSAAVKKDSGIERFEQLKGKTIVTTSGTTSVPLLKKYAKAEDADFKEIYGKDHAESFLLMADGRAAAFVMDDILLAGQIANSKDPSAYRILPGSLRSEPYSMMLRKNDPQFKAMVEVTIGAALNLGATLKLYSIWFPSPIRTKGFNLISPLNDANKQAFENPNDQGVE